MMSFVPSVSVRRWHASGRRAPSGYTVLSSILGFAGTSLIGEASEIAVKTGNYLNYASLVISTGTILVNGRASTANVLDLISGSIAFTPFSFISYAYFGLNLWSMATTRKSIGDRIDEKYIIIWVPSVPPAPLFIPRNNE